jgi:hypothetical protein
MLYCVENDPTKDGMDPKHVQLHKPYKPKLLFESIAFVAIDIDPRFE